MSKARSRSGIGALVVMGALIAGCSRGPDGPDLDSPAVQQAWLRANEEKMLETLGSQGFRMEKTGESQIKVATYSRRGNGVCVIFVDSKNDPPQAAMAAYLLRTSEDGSSWRIAGYVAAGGAGGKMKTVTFQKSITDREAPDVAFELDVYLRTRGIEREKFAVEIMF